MNYKNISRNLTLLLFSLLLPAMAGISDTLKFNSFRGLHHKINPQIEELLEKKKFGKTVWYYDNKNKVDGKWELYPWVTLSQSLTVVNVSTIQDKKGYTFLLLVSSGKKIEIIDTLGPYYDCGFTAVSYRDITADKAQELLIRYYSEPDLCVDIYTAKGKKWAKRFSECSTEGPVVADIDNDGIYEVTLEESLMEEEYLFENQEPLKPVIYYYSNDTFVKSEKGYCTLRKSRVGLYKKSINKIESWKNSKDHIFFEMKDNFIKTLRSWIKEADSCKDQ